MAELLAGRDWDYVVGSIHFVGDGALDHDDYDIWSTGQSPDQVWRTYFEWLGEAAASGMFDILAHPDLVKHWGRERPRPERDLRYFYELAMDGIAESGIAIEVSTAGLRKPVGELYPARAFLEMVPRRRQPDRALERRPHARATSAATTSGARAARRPRRHASSRSSSAASAGWSRSDEPDRDDRHRLGLAPPRPRAPADPRRRRDPARARPRRATPTPTCSTHAVIDALLGAAALGDIGQHFPDTDER